MATEWSCPICLEASANIAYVSSCLHQFCLGCIMRWASKKPSCPLCRRTVQTIIYAAPATQGLVEMAVSHHSAPPSSGPREEPGAAGQQPQSHVAGLPHETWALSFRRHADTLRPVELWLTEVLCGASWWDVAVAHGSVLASLCRYGLHVEALARELQPFLQGQTAAFVRQLIAVAAWQCSELVRRHTNAARERASPDGTAIPSTSAAQQPNVEPGQAAAERRLRHPALLAVRVPQRRRLAGLRGCPQEAVPPAELERCGQHQEKRDRGGSGNRLESVGILKRNQCKTK